MKKLFFILSVSTLIYSCKPEHYATPDPILSPPQWFVGEWNYSDSTGILERMTVSETNLIIQSVESNSTMDYIDYFKTNDISYKEMFNHNISYGFEYSENNVVKEINFGIIGDNEVRFMDENGPTLKTFKKE